MEKEIEGTNSNENSTTKRNIATYSDKKIMCAFNNNSNKKYIENLWQRLQLPLDRLIAKKTLKSKRIDKKEFSLQSFFNFCSKSNNTEEHCSEDFHQRRLNKQ